jgi:hypothetical protein
MEFSAYDPMPNNWLRKCKTDYDNERELYGVLQMEQINMFGVPMEYYATSYNLSAAQQPWSEDENRQITNMYNIMATYELPHEDNLWSKFGIEGIDNFHIYISKMHFNAASGGTGLYPISGGDVPKVGDILKAKYNNYFYQILMVHQEEEMFEQYKHSWDLTVKPYRDNKFTTTPSTSATSISAVTNQNVDIFNIKTVIDDSKNAIIYTSAVCEQAPTNIWGTW